MITRRRKILFFLLFAAAAWAVVCAWRLFFQFPKGQASIPAGSFFMGCSPGDDQCQEDELPRHEVAVRGFFMDRYEVTNRHYAQCVAAGACNPSHLAGNPTWAPPDNPVVGVMWTDAEAFCKWKGMRLPFEEEWEYAARAGTDAPRYGELDSIAWHRFNSENVTHRAGMKQPNAWGLYDMLGNAREWVQDWFDNDVYRRKTGEVADPLPQPENKVLRGGSWNNDQNFIRASYRHDYQPDFSSEYIGFRCAKDR